MLILGVDVEFERSQYSSFESNETFGEICVILSSGSLQRSVNLAVMAFPTERRDDIFPGK